MEYVLLGNGIVNSFMHPNQQHLLRLKLLLRLHTLSEIHVIEAPPLRGWFSCEHSYQYEKICLVWTIFFGHAAFVIQAGVFSVH
jgi:hypothetical protein